MIITNNELLGIWQALNNLVTESFSKNSKVKASVGFKIVDLMTVLQPYINSFETSRKKLLEKYNITEETKELNKELSDDFSELLNKRIELTNLPKITRDEISNLELDLQTIINLNIILKK